MHSATPGRGGECARGFGKFVGADGDLLAQRDGRGFVIHANENDAPSETEPVHVAEEIGGPDGHHDDKGRAGNIGGATAAQCRAAPHQQQSNVNRPTWRRRQ